MKLHSIYWAYRLSIFSRPYYTIKTFFHLHLKARQTAIVLDNCVRALGQMHHVKEEHSIMTMSVETRGNLISQANKTLPCGWRWRKD